MRRWTNDARFWLRERLHPGVWLSRLLDGGPPMRWREIRRSSKDIGENDAWKEV